MKRVQAELRIAEGCGRGGEEGVCEKVREERRDGSEEWTRGKGNLINGKFLQLHRRRIDFGNVK
jgi:hypothetical protein